MRSHHRYSRRSAKSGRHPTLTSNFSSTPHLYSHESPVGHRSAAHLSSSGLHGEIIAISSRLPPHSVLYSSAMDVAVGSKSSRAAAAELIPAEDTGYDSLRRMVEEKMATNLRIGSGGGSEEEHDGSGLGSDGMGGAPDLGDPEEEIPTASDLLVSRSDMTAVESCYRGNKTEVYVCSSLANLYALSGGGGWELRYTGIPLLLLDYGDTRSRVKRQIQIVLAERGTGFSLWRDVVDNLSAYKAEESHFHTMCLSHDHKQRVGLSFDNPRAAMDFYRRIETLTSDPANISLSGPRGRKKKAAAAGGPSTGGSGKYRAPSKREISQPCAFQHVISVDHGDRAKYFSLQAFVSSPPGSPVASSDGIPDPIRVNDTSSGSSLYSSSPSLVHSVTV